MTFPSISASGLAISEVATNVLGGATDTQLHRFVDGRICIPRDGGSYWTTNGGASWNGGVLGAAQGAHKMAVELGSNETLSLHRTCTGTTPGPYDLGASRSTNGWATVTPETVSVDTPDAVPLIGDAGGSEDAMLLHHGIEILADGRLLATAYGLYDGDDEPASGYPVAFGMKKWRTVGLFSADKGATWGDPVTIGGNLMLARGTDPDWQVQTYADCPLLSQEGLCEAELTRAPNGDLLCFMRSGGRLGFPYAPTQPTPLYMSRSTDEGVTWSTPRAIAPFGCNPNAVTLATGVIVLVYSRPATWVCFSDDNGETWKGHTQVSGSDAYADVVRVDADTCLLAYFGSGGVNITRLRVRRNGQGVPADMVFLANPMRIEAGQSSELTLHCTNSRNGVLNGGPWSDKPIGGINFMNTGPLYATTTFTLDMESVSDGSIVTRKEVTVTVL